MRLGNDGVERRTKQSRVHLISDLLHPPRQHGECDGIDGLHTPSYKTPSNLTYQYNRF